MSAAEAWYIVKAETGHCIILPEANLPEAETGLDNPPAEKRWGPFDSQAAAIARRVGLIRAGKCQPR